MQVALVSVEVSKLGGVERYAHCIANLLRPVVFTNRTDGIISARHIPSIGRPDLLRKEIFPILSTVLCRRSGFDIVHSMGVSHLSPHCVTAHTSGRYMLRLLERGELFFHLSPLRKLYWRARLFVPAALERWMYRKNIPIVPVSNLLRNVLGSDYGIPGKRITVIYPGVDTEEFKPSAEMRERTRERLGLRGKVVLFVGGQDKRKGLHFLIEALRGLDVTLLICGGEHRDMPAVYNACDILVLPSLFDSFGFPVLEAMASGIPVIVSKNTGASELVDGTAAGLVLEDPRDIGDIRRKIVSLLGDKERLYDMGNEARQIALRYNLSHFRDSLLKFYESLFTETAQRNSAAGSSDPFEGKDV